LFVAASERDLSLIRNTLSNFPAFDSQIEIAVHPTVLILKPDRADNNFDGQIAEFLLDAQKLANRSAVPRIISQEIARPVELSYNQEVERQLEKNNYDIVFIPHGTTEGWRTKIAFRQRGKILAFIGTNTSWSNIMVPVDMSISTLLTLTFLKEYFHGKTGINIQFIHVLSGEQKNIDQRWLKIKRLVGIDKRIPLRIIKPDGGIADDLIRLTQTEKFDAIFIGRRGLSGIKRWLLGSVSVNLLRRIRKESLIIID
jgi:2,4-dienoyl-CoA reductase (NADPH2)